MFRKSTTLETHRPMTVRLRTLEESDLSAADGVLRAAFERDHSFIAHLRLTSALEPGGVLVAEENGKILGTVGAVDYGQLAYIGLMAVDPKHQSHGIGRRLICRLLEWLDGRGCPRILLDATDKGALLYETLGFVDDSTASVFELADATGTARGERIAQPRGASQIRTARPNELTEIAAFDAPIFGADRGKLFQALKAECQDRTLLARDRAGKLVGYLFARDPVLGPWAATRRQVAEDLLSAALELPFANPPLVLVPRSNDDCARLLSEQGFSQRRCLRHMRRGGTSPTGQPTRLFGQASFAHG